MKEIKIKGYIVLIDDEDEEFVSSFSWSPVSKKNGYAYFQRFVKKKDRVDGKRCVYLHRELMNAPNSLEVDHKDRNPLNNQKSNLRLATRSQNARNSKNSKKKYQGVYKRPSAKKWIAYIQDNNKRINIGTYDTEIDAAFAYDNAARKHFGEFAYLNFPNEHRSPKSYADNLTHSKGICWHKRNKRWEARIFINGEYKFLGSFVSEIDAQTAYKKAKSKKKEKV